MSDPSPQVLWERMVGDGQLSSSDLPAISDIAGTSSDVRCDTESGVLQWVAREYQVPFDELESVQPDKQLLALFPARILLKEELLPLRRENGRVEIATGRLFSTSGIDDIYEAAVSAGALGGKILGAGGGGFMLLFVPPERQQAVRVRLGSLLQVPFDFESGGSQIIYYDHENVGTEIPPG
jgi:hypothetical protein